MQGITLAETGKPLFLGGFEAWTHGPVEPSVWQFVANIGHGWPERLARHLPQLDDSDMARLRDVYHVVGVLTAREMSEATHAERPWAKARDGIPWDHPSRVAINQTSIHDFFANILEAGEDAMADLDIAKEPDAPWWRKPFELGVNLQRLTGHPLFNDERSRALRKRIGLPEFPEDWTNLDLGENGLTVESIRRLQP